MTTLVENQKLIESYFNDVWNGGDIDLLDEIISPEYINHSPGISHPAKGSEGLKPIVMAMRIGFPDLHFKIKDIVVTEQKVAIRSTMSGTHLGDLFGMRSTGKICQDKSAAN